MAAARPSAGYQLTVVLFTLLLVTLAVHSLASFWRVPLPGSWILLLAGFSALYGWLWWRSRRTWLVCTAVAAAASAYLVRRDPIWRWWLAHVTAEGRALLAELAAGNLAASFDYELGFVLVVLAGVGAGLLIAAETLGRGRAFWTIGLGLLLFGTQWGWYYQPSLIYFQAYLVLALMLWAVGQAAVRDARWRSEGRHGERRPGLAPALVGMPAVALVATLLPSHFAPVSLGELGQRIQDAVPALRQFRGGGVESFSSFSLAATGFAPDLGRLGGAVRPDDRVALRVAVSGPLTGTLYLRGAILPTYTGSTWEPGDSLSFTLSDDSLLPSLMGPETRWRSLTVEVTPVLNFGRTIFHVLETTRVDGLSGYTADVEANLEALQPIVRGATYTVSARVPQYSSDQIRATDGVPGLGMARYLQLPEDLPRRIGDLARSVTEGEAHPFDQAVAIESFLRQIPYTLTPPPTPADRDFVDFFLFSAQQGYCVYHASAMVVMLRELGIPARFVEGYAIPASTPFTLDARGRYVYEVRNTQAHAWVEAYFPGYGWVTFDPTPRADLPVIARSAPLTLIGNEEPMEEEPVETAEPALIPTPASPQAEESPQTGDLPDSGGGTAAAPADRWRRWPRYAAVLAPPVLLALAAALALQAQERFRYRDARSVVQEAWEKTGDLLGRFGLGRRPDQTPAEYARTLATALPPLGEVAVRAAADYSAARYGPPGRPVLAADAKRARAFWRRAKEVLLDQFGWRTYLWRRLRWRGRR